MWEITCILETKALAKPLVRNLSSDSSPPAAVSDQRCDSSAESQLICTGAFSQQMRAPRNTKEMLRRPSSKNSDVRSRLQWPLTLTNRYMPKSHVYRVYNVYAQPQKAARHEMQRAADV